MNSKIVLTFSLLFIAKMLVCQQIDTTSDSGIKEKVLQDIRQNLEVRTAELDSTVLVLDKKVSDLDRAIQITRDAEKKADKLLERVKALEDKQLAIESNEMNLTVANYQSAIINLVSMEREIKPLLLFDASRSFFEDLTETSNPMGYPNYKSWYKEFKSYIDKEKSRNSNLMVLNSLIKLTGDVSGGAPLVGPLAQSTFTGISDFIGSLSNRQRELRAQSEKMLLLSAKLSQFSHDKEIIEKEWESITQQLEALEKFYSSLLNQNLEMLGISPASFERDFSKEHDALKRTKFLIDLSKISKERILAKKNKELQNWKEPFYFQQMDVQALKIRFGEITKRVIKNFDRYDDLFMKYTNDPQLGPKVRLLEAKLADMKNIFEDTFDPEDYINSATRMYQVD